MMKKMKKQKNTQKMVKILKKWVFYSIGSKNILSLPLQFRPFWRQFNGIC